MCLVLCMVCLCVPGDCSGAVNIDHFPGVLLLPEADDKKSMSHLHKHKLSLSRYVLAKGSMLLAHFDNCNMLYQD